MTKEKSLENQNISFTEEEIQTILECLLFSSSVDVCASWYQEDVDKMLKLTEKIRHKFQSIPIENVYLSHFSDDDNLFVDKHSSRILSNFPEMNHIQKESL
jgi:hypothetical protein